MTYNRMKGNEMGRIGKAVILGLAAIVIAMTIAGCRKSEPDTKSQGTATEQKQTTPAPEKETAADEKTVVEETKPKRPEPTEADIALMEAALLESDFQQGVLLKAGDEVIDIQVGHLVPHAVDWNNDGKKDLIVGQFSGGSINLYLNIGTDEEPVLDKGKLLEAGEKPISMAAG